MSENDMKLTYIKIWKRVQNEIKFITNYKDLNTQVDLLNALANYYLEQSKYKNINHDTHDAYLEVVDSINNFTESRRNKIYANENIEVEEAICNNEDELDDNFDENKLNSIYDNSEENSSIDSIINFNKNIDEETKHQLINVTYEKAVQAGFFDNVFELGNKIDEEIKLLNKMHNLSIKIAFANALINRYQILNDCTLNDVSKFDIYNNYDLLSEVYLEGIAELNDIINETEIKLFNLEEDDINNIINKREGKNRK